MNALYLAFAYLRYHWARSLVLTVVAALILFVPVVYLGRWVATRFAWNRA